MNPCAQALSFVVEDSKRTKGSILGGNVVDCVTAWIVEMELLWQENHKSKLIQGLLKIVVMTTAIYWALTIWLKAILDALHVLS